MTNKRKTNNRKSVSKASGNAKSLRERRKRAYMKLGLTGVIAVCTIVVLNLFILPRFFDGNSYATTLENGVILSQSQSQYVYATAGDTGSSSTESSVVHTVDVDIQSMLLTVNEYSRPGTSLDEVSGVVVHYTGNPGTTAAQNRSYFESLKTGEDGVYASSHFIIGLEGEIIQCIPLDEIAYASNEANSYTISIECCHEDETGQLNEATYQSLVNLTTWLCEEFSLDSADVIRHYDVTGKECPLYFVDNEDAWYAFRSTITEMLNQ